MKVEKANAITAGIDAAVSSIGKSGDLVMPRSRGNSEPAAWELFVASAVKRLAEARLRKAEKAARDVGLIFDPEKEQRPVGTNVTLHDGDVVKIQLEVGTPQTRLDMDLFIAGLERAGLTRAKIDRLRTQCTVNNRAPHKFTASLVTS